MSVELIGHQQVRDRFERIEKPPESVVEAPAKKGAKELEANYENNRLDWKELKPETVRRKGSSRILYQSGTMSRSYKFRKTGPLTWEYYSTDKAGKVKYHEGTRPHFKLREEELQEMTKEYLRELLK